MSVGKLKLLAAAPLAAAVLVALVAIFDPPYSDAQIRESIVDTWAASAIATDFFLVVCLVSLIASVVIALRLDAAFRRSALLGALASLVAGLLAVRAHIDLTTRTTQLTGQTFSARYGLF
jgi:hypothetical protein